MKPLAFIKKWTLPCAMICGAIVYAAFTNVSPLIPIGEAVAPYIMDSLPVLIFIMLYITFCKIRTKDLRPQAWHGWLVVIMTLFTTVLTVVISLTDDHDMKLVLEGALICIICPTAAAAPVVADKLGGNVTSLTVYGILSNVAASLLIPLLFPIVEKEADISFTFAFITILRRVVVVVVLPLVLAMLTLRYLPKVAGAIKKRQNTAFYIWCFNLSIAMGITIHNISTATVGGLTLALLIVLPLVVTITLFAIGKSVGRKYDDSISAGQGFGQKNTFIGIWLTVTFLHPTAVIAPCAYVIWQNIVNSWQLWYKGKYGKLKW